MARSAFTLRITNPAGQSKDIPVKMSTQVRLEEQIGVPVWQRMREGYSGSFARLGYLVGHEDGFIPPDMTFDDLLDADGDWTFDIITPDTAVTDAEGNA